MNLEVHETYITRGGWKAIVLYRLNDPVMAYVVVHDAPGNLQDVCRHHEDGRFRTDRTESDLDLLERVGV